MSVLGDFENVIDTISDLIDAGKFGMNNPITITCKTFGFVKNFLSNKREDAGL